MRASASERIMVPRALRFVFWERLDSPWRLPAALPLTFPLPVKQNRFLALDLVFSFGISFFLVLIGFRHVEFQERLGMPLARSRSCGRVIPLSSGECKAATKKEGADPDNYLR